MWYQELDEVESLYNTKERGSRKSGCVEYVVRRPKKHSVCITRKKVKNNTMPVMQIIA